MQNNKTTEVWLLELPLENFEPARFIGLGDVAEYCQHHEHVRVRLEGSSQAMQTKLMQLPGERWQVLDGKLVPPNHRVPVRSMPECDWLTADEWFTIELPQAGIARRPTDSFRTALRLERGGKIQAPAAIDGSLAHLKQWAESASEKQLQALNFTVCPNDPARCLIIGNPLPPIDGTYLIESERTLIPAGYCWAPAVDAKTLRHAFDLENSTWLYWESNEVFHFIEEHQLAPLSRASIRSLGDV